MHLLRRARSPPTSGTASIAESAGLGADWRCRRLRVPSAPRPPPRRRDAGQATSPPRRRLSAGTTLIAGVATLLLALGIGVEIGRLGNHFDRDARAGQRTGAGRHRRRRSGGAGGRARTARRRTASKHKAARRRPRRRRPRTSPRRSAAKATAAAAKVLGSSSSNLPPPTVTVGGACPAGKAGCQNGHFTGNFFGP